MSSKRKKVAKKDTHLRFLVIGDPHLKDRQTLINEAYAKRVVGAAQKYKPDVIVVLGDLLHNHNKVQIEPHNVVTEIVDEFSKICHTYILIGNHDLIDSNQFLTTHHIFGPLKKWPNVTIVDKPIYVKMGKKEFVMCPFVPPGRFREALDTLVKEEHMWEMVDCIFAHQEVKGCRYMTEPSQKGDVWDPDYPPIISGHIHDEQTVGTNVFYPGASMQHTFGESPNKCIWLVTFADDLPDGKYFTTKKISLGMREKLLINVSVDEVEEFDLGLLEKGQIKLRVRGTSSELSVLKKSKTYAYLKKKGVLFSDDTILGDDTHSLLTIQKNAVAKMSYVDVFSKLVDMKGGCVKRAYDDIFGGVAKMPSLQQDETCELVFEE